VRWDEILDGNLEREGRRRVRLSFFPPFFSKSFILGWGVTQRE
jgi:hypothetical protein